MNKSIDAVIASLEIAGLQDLADKVSEVIATPSKAEIISLIKEARRSIQAIDEALDNGDSIDPYYAVLKSFVKETVELKDPDTVMAADKDNEIIIYFEKTGNKYTVVCDEKRRRIFESDIMKFITDGIKKYPGAIIRKSK